MKKTPINEDLRKKLIALGIPLERQDASSLSHLFPPEFKVANFGLSQTDIAHVLVSFVENGLISLSHLSNEAAFHREVGSHICHFYRGEDEMIKMTASFLEEGMRAGERCIWVLPAWLTKDCAREASQVIRPTIEEAEASGRISFLTENEVYLDHQGVIRTAEGIIQFWIEEEQKAHAADFTGLRITGDGTGLVSTDKWTAGVDYERLADQAFQGRTITALCTYSLADVSPNRLAEILGAHNCGVISKNRTWNEVRPGAGVATAIEFLHVVQ